jgi:YggT family protein
VELFVRSFAQLFLLAVAVLLFARVLVSWVDPRMNGRFSVAVVGLTEPFLAPVRRLMPSTGMLDLSPTVLLIGIFLLLRLL